MKSKTLVPISAAVLWLAAASFLHAADPALGTWKLNVAKSKYSPGPAPKSGNLSFESSGDAVKRTGEQVAADGKKSSLSYTAKMDGKFYPVTGTDLYDEISIKKIDDHNTEASMKRAGKVAVSAKRNISKDGKVMTITITGTNAKGEKINNISVYDKQ
ncbi:MAG TPA: hypothetical protein VFJ27_06235 [Terriglobia bacterium]|nr:hypothetical protein [Terriglobia bacterium]